MKRVSALVIVAFLSFAWPSFVCVDDEEDGTHVCCTAHQSGDGGMTCCVWTDGGQFRGCLTGHTQTASPDAPAALL